MRFDVISKFCFLHIVCYRCNLIITILMCTLSKKKKEALWQQHGLSPGGAWKGRVSPGYSGVGSAI